jgi:Ca-activated chloride channel homolog
MARESTSISGWSSAPLFDFQRRRCDFDFRLWAVRLLFGLVLLPLIAPAVAQQPAAPPEPIRVSVDRVNVGVTVTDSRGKFIGGLRREDFQIFDDDVEQPVTDFAPVDEPAQVLMLVEAGPSVFFLEAGHVRASHALLAGLSPGDRVAVAKYDAAAQVLLDFTPDKQVAENALGNVRYYVGFGTLNLSQSLSSVLDWLAKMQGKKTIVLLSTGFDTSFPEATTALLTRLKTSDVRILAISLGAELRNSAPNPKNKKRSTVPPEKTAIAEQGFADADRLLSALTQTTGGRVYFPNTAKEFSEVYAQIAELVRHEYSLAFAPPAHDGQPHTIDVRVTPSTSDASGATTATSAYRIDHRRAYLAPTP